MNRQGIIALMGSGELASTMVEVHKALLRPYGQQARAVFLDTPAGFQLNADLISRQAVDYFHTHVQQPLSVASFKSLEDMPSPGFRRTVEALGSADLIFVGPGSPTYALRQWRASPIPGLIRRRLASGGCLVAASAAALTVGRFTLPVYEIYKVGHRPHWVAGLDILARFGLNLAVIPHWNNSEGHHHDTRYCFMGAPRLNELMEALPGDVGILGIDEHTAVIIDAQRQTATIRGRGTATLMSRGRTQVLDKDQTFPLDIFTMREDPDRKPAMEDARANGRDPSAMRIHLDEMYALADDIIMDRHPDKNTTQLQALLECEDRLWHQLRQADQVDHLAAVRGILRNVLMALGRCRAEPGEDEMTPLVDALLNLRETYRRRRNWQTADELRDCLQQANVVVTDTADGSRWHKR